jgi:hypothetical protein
MEITLKNKFCLYAIIPNSFFSITICNLLIDFPSYEGKTNGLLIAFVGYLTDFNKFQ